MKNEKEYSIRDIQNKQLELLHELDRVCKLLDIPYYLAAGTALGALRHEGFIPWDDDVDVFMHWKDVEVLLKNTELFEQKYFLQCRETEPNINTVLCRLRDSSTTCIMDDDKDADINHGVFIDIYILYPYPDGKIAQQKIIFDSFIFRILQADDGPKNHGKLAYYIGKFIAHHYRNNKEKKIEKIISEYKNNGGENYLAIYFGEDIKLFWSRKYLAKWFKKPSNHKFEDIVASCPTDLEEYCKFRYGDNCMELPPVEKRTTNHSFVKIDLETSYLKYNKRNG